VLNTGWLLAVPTKVTDVITGKVIAVTDGDTIKVLVDNQPITVRLEGIDAPELRQSFGARSKQALADMLFGKVVTVRKTGDDRFGRTLGIVMVGDVDANATMVQDGWAWHFKKYNDETRLAELETETRAAKRGLWTEANPLARWDCRARQRTPETRQPNSEALFWLNISSGVRHNERCEHFQNTKRGRLCTPDEGKACGICGG
jgi:endonuclease YncB( thermonuclease family)